MFLDISSPWFPDIFLYSINSILDQKQCTQIAGFKVDLPVKYQKVRGQQVPCVSLPGDLPIFWSVQGAFSAFFLYWLDCWHRALTPSSSSTPPTFQSSCPSLTIGRSCPDELLRLRSTTRPRQTALVSNLYFLSQLLYRRCDHRKCSQNTWGQVTCEALQVQYVGEPTGSVAGAVLSR